MKLLTAQLNLLFFQPENLNLTKIICIIFADYLNLETMQNQEWKGHLEDSVSLGKHCRI